MFTGIIQEQAPVVSCVWTEDFTSCRVAVRSRHPDRASWKLGDSVALDGACLTIVAIETPEADHSIFYFDVSAETLAKTHFGRSFKKFSDFATKKIERAFEHNLRDAELTLHLEGALRMGDALGGHLVSGHVEGAAQLTERLERGGYLELQFSLARDAARLAAFLIPKGSVALDGTSLTINSVVDSPDGTCTLSVLLIPHTLEHCHFGRLEPGDWVNLETDLLARHFCRYKEISTATVSQTDARGERHDHL